MENKEEIREGVMKMWAVPIYELRKAVRVVLAPDFDAAQMTADGYEGYGTIISTGEMKFY